MLDNTQNSVRGFDVIPPKGNTPLQSAFDYTTMAGTMSPTLASMSMGHPPDCKWRSVSQALSATPLCVWLFTPRPGLLSHSSPPFPGPHNHYHYQHPRLPQHFPHNTALHIPTHLHSHALSHERIPLLVLGLCPGAVRPQVSHLAAGETHGPLQRLYRRVWCCKNSHTAGTRRAVGVRGGFLDRWEFLPLFQPRLLFSRLLGLLQPLLVVAIIGKLIRRIFHDNVPLAERSEIFD